MLPPLHLPGDYQLDDIRLVIDRKSLGAVRISVGLVSNFEDVYQLVVFANRLCRGESAE